MLRSRPPHWEPTEVPVPTNHSRQEATMGRKFIDCRDYPSQMHCTVALSADTEEELLEAAVQHAVQVHEHQDTPELRSQLKACFKDGSPPS